VTAFVFGFPPSSRPQIEPTTRGPTTGVLGAIIWAIGLALGSVANAVVFVDDSALARWSTVFDGPSVSWVSAIAGYTLIGSSTRLSPSSVSSRRLRPVSVLALVAWTYHLLLLRWPWLIATVSPSTRLSVYSGTLSQSLSSVPVYAFGELLASAVLLTHATLYLLAAAHRKGWFPRDNCPSVARFCLVSIAVALYFLSAAFTIDLATGRI
jgi:hypothetical protein